MIKAKIKTVDGDEFEIAFENWQAEYEWMERNRGKYISVGTEEMDQGGIEHDNDGIDQRVTRSSGS